MTFLLGGKFETYNDPQGNPLISLDRDGTVEAVAVQFPDGTKLSSTKSGVISIADYGAVGNANIVIDGRTTNNNTTLTSATANFQAVDVGKQFSVTPTLYSRTAQITGTIAAVLSSSAVQLSTPALSTATGVRFTYGTDNTAAIQDAIAAVQGLAQGGEVGSPVFTSLIPPLIFPTPAKLGYLVAGQLTVTSRGVTFASAGGTQATQVILNTSAAQVRVHADGETQHCFEVDGLVIEGNYIADYGIYVDSVEENEFTSLWILHCLTAGFYMNAGGEDRFFNLRLSGNVVGVWLNNSTNVVFYGPHFGGFGNSTLTGLKLSGSCNSIKVDGGFWEALLKFVILDNTSGDTNVGFTLRDNKFLSTISQARLLYASAQNTSNQYALNAVFESNFVSLSSASFFCDLLLNGDVHANTVLQLLWKNNTIVTPPSTSTFNTDSATTKIVYADNFNGGAFSTIVSGAALVTGADGTNPVNGVFGAGIALYGHLNMQGASIASTVGAAGAGSALPATPVGYLVVNIGGTNYKLPYYNN